MASERSIDFTRGMVVASCVGNGYLFGTHVLNALISGESL